MNRGTQGGCGIILSPAPTEKQPRSRVTAAECPVPGKIMHREYRRVVVEGQSVDRGRKTANIIQ